MCQIDWWRIGRSQHFIKGQLGNKTCRILWPWGLLYKSAMTILPMWPHFKISPLKVHFETQRENSHSGFLLCHSFLWWYNLIVFLSPSIWIKAYVNFRLVIYLLFTVYDSFCSMLKRSLAPTEKSSLCMHLKDSSCFLRIRKVAHILLIF